MASYSNSPNVSNNISYDVTNDFFNQVKNVYTVPAASYCMIGYLKLTRNSGTGTASVRINGVEIGSVTTASFVVTSNLALGPGSYIEVVGDSNATGRLTLFGVQLTNGA